MSPCEKPARLHIKYLNFFDSEISSYAVRAGQPQ